MIRLASSPTLNPKLLARSALTMLSPSESTKDSPRELPAASEAALDVLRDWAKADGDGAAPHLLVRAGLHLEEPTSGHPQEIAIADWDALFRAVEARLTRSVIETPAPAPYSLSGPAAELVQSTVLECVGALHQLHLALAQERSQRGHLQCLSAAGPGAQDTQRASSR